MRTADVLGQAVGGAEDQGVQAALLEGAEEGVHALHADRLRAAHDKLQAAQVPLLLLLRRRLPAGIDMRNLYASPCAASIAKSCLCLPSELMMHANCAAPQLPCQSSHTCRCMSSLLVAMLALSWLER